MSIKTVSEVYAAINPIPAMLSARGKKKPRVTIEFEANARVYIFLRWEEEINKSYNGEEAIECVSGDDVDAAVKEALEIIYALPSAEDAKLHQFMGQLGKVIDAGRDLGIEVDYLNPLTKTMKRLSENIITHQPRRAS